MKQKINSIIRLISFLESKFILFTLVLITTFSVVVLQKLKFIYDIESFFQEEDKDVVAYEEFKQSFGNENNKIVFAFINNPDVFNKKFLEKIDLFSDSIESLMEVENVISPSNSWYDIKVPIVGVVHKPLVNLENDSTIEASKIYALKDTDIYSTFFGENYQSLQVIAELNNQLTQQDAILALSKVEAVARHFQLTDFHVAGRSSTQRFYIATMHSEMTWLSIGALVLFVFTLVIVLKSFYLVFFSLIAILLSVVNSLAWIVVFDYHIDVIMIILPAILIVTGTSIIVHLNAYFQRGYSVDLSRNENVFNAVKSAFKPIFYSTVTTSIGFFTLSFIPVLPLQMFGLFVGIGILVTAFITVLTMIVAMKWSRVTEKKAIVSKPIDSVGNQRSWAPLIVSFIIIVVGVVAISNLKSNSYFLEDLDPESSLGEDLQFFELNHDGVRPVELVVQRSFSDTNDLAFFRQLEKLENKIKDLYQIKNVLSAVGIIKFTEQNLHLGKRSSNALPIDSASMATNIKSIKRSQLLDKLKLFNEVANIYRISFRTKDLGSDYQFSKSESLTDFVNDSLPLLKVKQTGVSMLIDKVNDSLSSSLIYGLISSILVVTLLFWVITKSFWISIVSILPNILPLFFIFIMMWFFSIPLKIGTCMVFTIAFGLAVDDTIHYLVNYMEQRQHAKNAYEAARSTRNKVARPMIQSSLILGLGFVLFVFSGFQSIAFLGIMVSCTLFVALLADFYVLPSLLQLVESKDKKKNATNVKNIEICVN